MKLRSPKCVWRSDFPPGSLCVAVVHRHGSWNHDWLQRGNEEMTDTKEITDTNTENLLFWAMCFLMAPHQLFTTATTWDLGCCLYTAQSKDLPNPQKSCS